MIEPSRRTGPLCADYYPLRTQPMPNRVTGVKPHGGRLVYRLVPYRQRQDLSKRAEAAPRVYLSDQELSDLELIANGVYSPLTGFMSEDDYRSTVYDMHLSAESSGSLWSIPIVLRIDGNTARSLGQGCPGGDLALASAADGKLYGLMELEDIYQLRPRDEAAEVYGTLDPAHPGVASVLAGARWACGGPIWLLRRPHHPFPSYTLDPVDSRALFADRGWQTIVGFQTRNPLHRAHEYIQKCALEIVDGLMLSPLVGETKKGDIPAALRMQTYSSILDGYFPPQRAAMVVFPAAMRYAGPREAIFHALARKNYGCTHFIVGRDHAGVGNYYGPSAAQDLLRQVPCRELGITPLSFEHAFYCDRCGGMATIKTCPHHPRHWHAPSGTLIRSLLGEGLEPPVKITRKEVAEVLVMRANRSEE